MLTLDKFEEASEKVKEVTLETKLIYSNYLSEQTGNKVYLKPENMQFTGAYKVRGAYYKISTLSEEERERGLITASAGNHAQGVAYAAKCYGCKAKVFTKENGSLKKKMGCPDLLILLTNTVSHKMVISASQEAKRNNISVVRVHGSSAAALHTVLAEHCSAPQKRNICHA